MFNMNYFFSIYLFIISCFMFSFYFKHLMLMIISMEFMMIFMVFNFFIIIVGIYNLSYLLIYILTFSVCEGALVLSLMVMMVRLHGNDYVNSLMILKW